MNRVAGRPRTHALALDQIGRHQRQHRAHHAGDDGQLDAVPHGPRPLGAGAERVVGQRERPVAAPQAHERPQRNQAVDDGDEQGHAAHHDGQGPARGGGRGPQRGPRGRGDGDVGAGAHPEGVQEIGGQARHDEDDAHGRRRGEVVHPDDLGVDLRGQHVVAAAHQDGIPEVGHAEDEDDEGGRGQPGPGQRHGHPPERGERPGAQVLGGLLQRGVDVAQHVGDQEIGLREEGEHLRQHDAVEAVDGPVEAEPPRHHAVAPQQEDEGQGDQEGRRDEGQQGHQRHESLAGHGGPGHGVGQHHGHGDGEHRGDGGHGQAVDEDPQQPPRAEELAEVGERQARRPGHAHPQHLEHGPHDEREQQQRHDRGRRSPPPPRPGASHARGATAAR